MNRLKYPLLVASLMLGTGTANALDLTISSTAETKKTIILGQFFNSDVQVGVKNALSDFNNLKVETSNLPCKDVKKNLKTSYYCVETNIIDDNVLKGVVVEKYGSSTYPKTNFVNDLTNKTNKMISFGMADVIYKTIFGKDTVLNSKLAFVQRKNLDNGKKIFNLKVGDYKGKDTKTLLASPQPILSIDWSPDNKSLAYVSYEKVRSNVFIHNLETGGRTRITSFKGINAFPSWSPNGENIALSLSKDGSSDIYIYNVNKKHLKKITSFKYESTEPVWLSNSELVFTSDKTGNPYLYKLDLKTKRMSPLSRSYLYTTSSRSNHAGSAVYGIYSKGAAAGILEVDRNRNERVLVEDFFAESPSVGHGDETIMYSTKKGNKSILRAVDINGKLLYEIESAASDLKEPSYSN